VDLAHLVFDTTTLKIDINNPDHNTDLGLASCDYLDDDYTAHCS
jgi:hypothetical protein